MAEITFLFIHKARQWIENKEAVLPENAIPYPQKYCVAYYHIKYYLTP